jgi:hypothetical protein
MGSKRSTARGWAAVLVLVPVLAALAAPAPGLAGYRPPKHAIVLGDQAVARAAVVRKSDLPGTGWTSTPFPISDSLVGGIANKAVAKGACPGVNLDASRFTATGLASSPVFASTRAYLISTSEVMSSPVQARAYFGDQTSRAALRCSGELFLEGLRAGLSMGASSAKARMVSVTRLAVKQPVDGATGIRAVARITAGSQSATLTMDTIALREGRAIAVVDVGSFAGPPAPELERAVLAKLVDRLRASHA